MEWSAADSKALASKVYDNVNCGVADAMAFLFIHGQGRRFTHSYLGNQRASRSLSEQLLRNLETDYEQKRIEGFLPVVGFKFKIGEDWKFDAEGQMLFERHEDGFSMYCETAWSDRTISDSDLAGLREVAEDYYAEKLRGYATQLVTIRSIAGSMEELGKEVIYNEATKQSASVGRNEQCPCKSGKKYKKCHGR